MTKQEAIETIKTAIAQVEWDYPMSYAVALDKAIKALEQPEIVLCKDCKHGCGRGHGMYYQFIECGKTGAFHKEDWFCPNGKRR